ncbi:MAG TPA: phosphatase PAP2 family protein [Sphingomonas sp.]|jgi:undecaprenyl-diphosphatase|nr:phosphatase PAP2 family protein [Sphingomonas sp.]
MDSKQAERADVAVAMAAAPARHTLLIRGLGTLSEIADQPPLISACAAVAAVGLLTGNRRLARAGARALAAELVATKLKGIVKHRFDRTRPRVVAEGRGYRAEPGHDDRSEMNSFPSGHTAGAVAVARAVARVYPAQAIPAYAIAAGVGIVQVPRSKHYPSDVAAGAVVGVVSEIVVDRGTRLARNLLAATIRQARHRRATRAATGPSSGANRPSFAREPLALDAG